MEWMLCADEEERDLLEEGQCQRKALDALKEIEQRLMGGVAQHASVPPGFETTNIISEQLVKPVKLLMSCTHANTSK